MQCYVRRVKLESPGRVGCLWGWPVALPPSLLLAGSVVWLGKQVLQALVQVKPLTVSLFGEDGVRLDFLEPLQLGPLAQGAATLDQNPAVTFVSLARFSIAMGGLLWMLTVLVVGLAYNGIARARRGVEVELEPMNKPTTVR